MPSAEVEAIKKELVEINEFVRGRVAPVEKEVGLLREEAERIGREVSLLQEKEREVRRGGRWRGMPRAPGWRCRTGRTRVWACWTWGC